jgi:hypothetical protein
MKWVTRDVVHLERVATPWLIRRFIDPDAEFVFIGWEPDAKPPADAIPFAIPGRELSPHDKDGTSFGKALKKYNLSDPALESIDKVIAGAVQIIMHDYKPAADDRHAQIALGLIAVSEGVMLLQEGDNAVIEASLPIYDALYANFRAEHLRQSLPADPAVDPEKAMVQTVFVHTMTKFMRSIRR